MVGSPAFVEMIFSFASLVVALLMFRFLATGGPQFILIGDMDPDVVERLFDALMWLCGAIVLFQMFHIVILVLNSGI